MRILGIDPGSNATGFGVVDRLSGSITHVTHGVLRPSRSAPLSVRLAYIHAGIARVVAQNAPDIAVVERVFIASNPRSALVLGQARGVVLAALSVSGLEVAELAAREVKKAVAGTGAASKTQVQAMVMRLLELDTSPASDAADALAVAICQAQAGRLTGLGVSRRRRPRRVAGRVLPRSPQ